MNSAADNAALTQGAGTIAAASATLNHATADCAVAVTAADAAAAAAVVVGVGGALISSGTKKRAKPALWCWKRGVRA